MYVSHVHRKAIPFYHPASIYLLSHAQSVFLFPLLLITILHFSFGYHSSLAGAHIFFGLWEGLLNKTINQKAVKRMEMSFIWAKLRTIAWKPASEMITRSRVFSTVLYFVRAKNIKSQGYIFQSFQIKEQSSTYTASLHGLDTWERCMVIKGGQHWHTRKRGV